MFNRIYFADSIGFDKFINNVEESSKLVWLLSLLTLGALVFLIVFAVIVSKISNRKKPK
jgi:hypothetical protein